jgi:2-hydroxy-3-oxopropionate reductase
MSARVGIIGLGVMGRPMAANLLDAGFELVVHNRSPGPAEELAGRGAQLVDSPAGFAKADFVITMVPDTPDVELIARELIPALAEGSIWIDMSTISPAATRRLGAEVEKRGASLLDAPVSGGEQGAIDGRLSIMVGGAESAFERCAAVFKALGRTVVHMGPSGSGQVTKACNQIIVASAMQAMAEALVLAEKAGIDLERLIEVLQGGLARTAAMELRGQRAARGDFEPGFRARLHDKDLRIGLETGRSLDVPLPQAELTAQLYDELVRSGRGDLDNSAVVDLLRERAGLTP